MLDIFTCDIRTVKTVLLTSVGDDYSPRSASSTLTRQFPSSESFSTSTIRTIISLGQELQNAPLPVSVRQLRIYTSFRCFQKILLNNPLLLINRIPTHQYQRSRKSQKVIFSHRCRRSHSCRAGKALRGVIDSTQKRHLDQVPSLNLSNSSRGSRLKLHNFDLHKSATISPQILLSIDTETSLISLNLHDYRK